MTINDIKKDFSGKTSISYFDDEKYSKKGKKKHRDDDFFDPPKKKKGKKKKKKDYSGLSKSELRVKIVELGIDASGVDTNSKQSMREALSMGSAKRVKTKVVETTETVTVLSDRPPHYFDEDDGSYVIRNAVDCDDMHCFDAMCNIGAMRRNKRANDGFGELMNRIQQRVVETANAPKELPDVIDVDFTPVD